MKCPSCNIELKMSERSGIEIDYCPQCRGVWLDKGELDKIIERSGSGSNLRQNRNDDEYENDNYRNDEPNNQRRGNSFLGNLFDF